MKSSFASFCKEGEFFTEMIFTRKKLNKIFNKMRVQTSRGASWLQFNWDSIEESLAVLYIYNYLNFVKFL